MTLQEPPDVVTNHADIISDVVVEHHLSKPDHVSDVLDHVSDVPDAAKRRYPPDDNIRMTVATYLYYCNAKVELAFCLS